MDSKNTLYKLIEDFVSYKCDSKTFSDKFSEIYYLDIDEEELTDKERIYFEELLSLLERFSPYKEDLVNSDYFIGEKPVREKAIRILMILKKDKE